MALANRLLTRFNEVPMKMAALSICLVLASFSAALPADYDGYVYWRPSGSVVVITWDADPAAEGYEIYVWRMENSTRLLAGKILTTNQHTITFKTHGTYIYYARGFYTDTSGIRQFTEWSNSLDARFAIVGDRARAWVIYVP